MSYSDRRFWVSYILFIIIIGGILVLYIYIYITRLASNEVFSPSNKIRQEVGRAKDLSAPQYIRFLVNFIINNQEGFQTNSFVHSVNTSSKHNLQWPSAKLTFFSKNVHFMLASKFSSVCHLVWQSLSEKETFKVAIRKYFNTHSFYSVREFFMCKDDL